MPDGDHIVIEVGWGEHETPTPDSEVTIYGPFSGWDVANAWAWANLMDNHSQWRVSTRKTHA